MIPTPIPGFAGLSCKSNAVVLTTFGASPVSRARLSVKVSAIRNSTVQEVREAFSGRLRVELGYGPDHELVKERYSESHVTVRRAVDHSFLDEFCSHWSEACDLDA